jgi:5'-deoxynucleotidase YfbR-like HD superfamily hydrolase
MQEAPSQETLDEAIRQTDEWIQTYTSKKFYPRAPRPQDFDIRDIAHALSLQCRFSGHCNTFYSVAEHSVRVSLAVPQDTLLARTALMHDASEAYLSDICKPIKHLLGGYQEMEDELMSRLAARFNFTFPLPPMVKVADVVLLATEARDLMGPAPAEWNLPFKPLGEKIVPISPEKAKEWFLRRFAFLGG